MQLFLLTHTHTYSEGVKTQHTSVKQKIDNMPMRGKLSLVMTGKTASLLRTRLLHPAL